MRAKQTRYSFPLSENNAYAIFDLIHCNLWSPYNTASTCSAFYFLTLLHYFSRCVWIYLLAEKREIAQTLKNFLDYGANPI